MTFFWDLLTRFGEVCGFIGEQCVLIDEQCVLIDNTIKTVGLHGDNTANSDFHKKQALLRGQQLQHLLQLRHDYDYKKQIYFYNQLI